VTKTSRFPGKNSLLLLLVLSHGAVSLGQETHIHDACQERLKQLEDRVAQLERLVSRLASAENSALAAKTERTVSPAASATEKPAPPMRGGFQPPPELIPEVGKIGAEVGLLVGASRNPFQLNGGSFTAGFIDLPLFDKPEWLHGKLSYEISVGLSQSNTTFDTTSNVAQVANLAVLSALNPNGGLQNVVAAVSGTGAAPFPVKTSTLTRLRLLQVAPFSIKYTSTALDRWRIRPYALVGFGIYVTIHNQNPARGAPPTFGVRPDADIPPGILATVNSLFEGAAPFGGPLVAGQISQAAELEQRGLPGGHGNLDIGLHTGVGVAVRLNRNFSLGFDTRYNQISGSHGGFTTIGSRIGLHF
jgi:hypothetical protein